MLPVRAYRPARADIWGVYRYLASYDIGSRVGLRAAPGRVYSKYVLMLGVAACVEAWLGRTFHITPPMGKRKMCEGCGLKQPSCGLASELGKAR